MAEIVQAAAAMEQLHEIDDTVTLYLVNHALYRFVNKFHVRNDKPVGDFDLRYFTELATEIFSQHEVLGRILAGEIVDELYTDQQLAEWFGGGGPVETSTRPGS